MSVLCVARGVLFVSLYWICTGYFHLYS